jgi:hypothetical protein
LRALFIAPSSKLDVRLVEQADFGLLLKVDKALISTDMVQCPSGLNRIGQLMHGKNFALQDKTL